MNVLYTPEYISKCLKIALSKQSIETFSSIENLSTYLIDIINEFRVFYMNKNGIFLSDSIFLPYEHIDGTLLRSLQEIVQNNNIFSVLNTSNITDNVYSINTEDRIHKNQKNSVSTILCAFLILLNDIYSENQTTALSIYDTVLQNVFLQCRVNKLEIMHDSVKYGYIDK